MNRFAATPVVAPDSSRETIAPILDQLKTFTPTEFASAEVLLATLKRQQRTASGFPRIRPNDCARVTEAIQNVYTTNRAFFRTCDAEIVDKFDEIVDAAAETDITFYPPELLKLRLLQAESRLARGDPRGAINAIGVYAERPYAVETGLRELTRLFELDGQARMLLGDVEGVALHSFERILMLARIAPLKCWSIVRRLAGLLAVGSAGDPRDGLFAYLSRKGAQFILKSQRGRGGLTSGVVERISEYAAVGLSGSCLLAVAIVGDIRRPRRANASSNDVLVTRGMGGIGDLLMMTPGLRALAQRQRRPVKFAVSAKFFPIFANNPHVELLDIDGPPLDVSKFGRWYNLTRCPAGHHESRRRPNVRKGRVELFAGGMGVRRRQLDRSGWEIELTLDRQQTSFRNQFIAARGLEDKPLVGVQPFSRDEYKDHPDIHGIIERLSQDYDVLIFHHLGEGLPSGPRVFSTAGLDLSQSLALVSALRVLVTIDSAFLHAAAAFDIPVVAMFGPTDGKLFTRHHRRANVLAATETFPCIPCWRNEDLPCRISGKTGTSPCIASISQETVVAAVARALQDTPGPRSKMTSHDEAL